MKKQAGVLQKQKTIFLVLLNKINQDNGLEMIISAIVQE